MKNLLVGLTLLLSVSSFANSTMSKVELVTTLKKQIPGLSQVLDSLEDLQITVTSCSSTKKESPFELLARGDNYTGFLNTPFVNKVEVSIKGICTNNRVWIEKYNIDSSLEVEQIMFD